MDAISGILTIDTLESGYVPQLGDEFRMFEGVEILIPPEAGGPFTLPRGHFTGWFDSIVLDGGFAEPGDWFWRWELVGGGTDVGPAIDSSPSGAFYSATLYSVPEPGTLVMLLGGGLGLVLVWRRRRWR